ncbi:MAG: phytase [Acidobacteriota bacterium]|nr:phytase [Acidobacteriota bacterium]
MNEPTKKTFGGKKMLLVLLALFLAVAVASEKVSAGFVFPNDSDKKSEKKKKEDKKKSKSDDDDDDDDDDDEQKDKEKEARKAEKALKEANEKAAKEAKKAESKSLTKASARPSTAPAPPAGAASVAGLEAIYATVETEPVPSGGDAADDPAIWIHPTDPSQSTIIGTNKQGGLAVYDLSGKQIQYLADGLMDNVDLREGFMLGGQKVAIVAASNRKDNSIALYKVNPATRQLENVAARSIKHTVTAYGMCLFRSEKSGKVFYFATSKSGDVEQWELLDANGKVDAKKVRNFKVGGVVEGCVTDDQLGHFYVSEEAVGIWKYSAEPETGTTRTQVAKVGDGNLFADVEGLAIAYGPNGTGYLMASSQGNYSYVVYRREGNNEFVKKFRIADGDKVDGAEETDGIDVTTANLGPAFPNGVFVVQDGFNNNGNQNFKLVPLQLIIK